MIKTWEQRCEEHPNHQSGMVSHTMIQARMQEEIDDLRAALAQSEQEPVAWLRQRDNTLAVNDGGLFGSDWTPLYTTPPERKPLTEEEINKLWTQKLDDFCWIRLFARAIEKAHGIGP